MDESNSEKENQFTIRKNLLSRGYVDPAESDEVIFILDRKELFFVLRGARI